MRVLYVVSQFPTFSETFIAREIRELVRLGVDVRIVSLKRAPDAPVQSVAAALLDRVIYPASFLRTSVRAAAAALRHPRRTFADLGDIAWEFRARPVDLAKNAIVWWRTQGMLPAIAAFGPDHVHAHYATYPSTAALFIADARGIPFSFTSHAGDVFGPPHLLARKLRTAAFSVTISQFNRRVLADRHVSDRVGDMQVIRCGVPLGEFPFKPDGRLAGHIVGVGRLDVFKGWHVLIEAGAMLAARGVAFTCDIISDGPLRAVLEQQIRRRGLHGRIRLLGALTQERMREHLYRASLFVLPCVPTTTRDVMDGIPVALMEAMASGTPVVSTTLSGIPELIEDGVSGLLAPPGDAGALARCIERVLTDHEYARTLAAHARARVEADFNGEREASKLHALLTRDRDRRTATAAKRVA